MGQLQAAAEHLLFVLLGGTTRDDQRPDVLPEARLVRPLCQRIHRPGQFLVAPVLDAVARPVELPTCLGSLNAVPFILGEVFPVATRGSFLLPVFVLLNDFLVGRGQPVRRWVVRDGEGDDRAFDQSAMDDPLLLLVPLPVLCVPLGQQLTDISVDLLHLVFVCELVVEEIDRCVIVRYPLGHLGAENGVCQTALLDQLGSHPPKSGLAHADLDLQRPQ